MPSAGLEGETEAVEGGRRRKARLAGGKEANQAPPDSETRERTQESRRGKPEMRGPRRSERSAT